MTIDTQPLFSRTELDAVIFELDAVIADTALPHTPPRVVARSVRLIQALRECGYRTAVVAASPDGSAIIRSADLETLFDVCIDGGEANRIGLRGKPAPDVFLHAARLLDVPPQRSAVIERTLAGVAAARAGDFALIVVLTDSGEPQTYFEHGADSVFSSLAAVTVAEMDCRPRPASALPSALAALPQILQARKELVLLLDYDGTLTPIVERPELAVLAPETRAILRDLASIMPVAIVSGRELDVLRALVGVPGLVYVGDHGFDMADLAGENQQLEAVQSYLPLLDSVEHSLREGLARVAGALLERKRSSIAVHFRLVAQADVAQVQARVREILSEHSQLKITPGKKVIEIQPDLDWDKGKAVEWLLPQIDASGRRHPIYIGDDVTDQHAFRVVCRRGTGILVRDDDHATAARYALENPGEVRLFLQQLAQSLRQG